MTNNTLKDGKTHEGEDLGILINNYLSRIDNSIGSNEFSTLFTRNIYNNHKINDCFNWVYIAFDGYCSKDTNEINKNAALTFVKTASRINDRLKINFLSNLILSIPVLNKEKNEELKKALELINSDKFIEKYSKCKYKEVKKTIYKLMPKCINYYNLD